MRIVHVTDAYAPRLGGIEIQVAELALHQQAAGHDVHILTCTDGPPVDTGPTVHRHGPAMRVAAMRFAAGSRSARRVLADLDPDIVHCHVSVVSPFAFGLARAATALNMATAMTVHSIWPTRAALPVVGFLVGVRGNAVAWSAVSEVAAGPVRRLVGSASQVTMLPNAIDVDWWREEAGGEREASVGCVRIVSVLRMARRKRPLPMLRMMAKARAALPADLALELVLIGDGPQRSATGRHARRLGMGGWVTLPGRLSRDQIREQLRNADIYLAPARLESFGIAALEARAVGVPVVAMSRGGVGEFVDAGIDGLLVGSDREMVEAIAALAGSESLRNAMHEHSRTHPPLFGWQDALARTDELYARAGQRASTSMHGTRRSGRQVSP